MLTGVDGLDAPDSHAGAMMGLVLAAGASRRMGRPKALLRYPPNGRTFVATIVDGFRAAGIANVIVVAGPNDPALRAELAAMDRPPAIAINPDPERGQLSSLHVGLDAADTAGASAVMVIPVDMPQIASSTIAAMAAAARESAAPILRATCTARHGHPVVFRRTVFDALRAADPNVGAKAVLRERAADVVDVEVGDPGVLRDVDSPDDYDKLST